MEDKYKSKISVLENELSKRKDEEEIFEKMNELELVTKKLDGMTKELQDALDNKDQEMDDILKLQAETEQRLNSTVEEVLMSFIFYKVLN